jgi:hypothetical protein
VQPQTAPHSPFPILQALSAPCAARTTLDAQGLTERRAPLVSGQATRVASAQASGAVLVARLQGRPQPSRAEPAAHDITEPRGTTSAAWDATGYGPAASTGARQW